jgi:hypothetical protein
MKKLIVISVIFALVSSAAFAETSITGGLTLNGELMNGNSLVVKDADDKPHYTHPGTSAIGAAGWQTQIGINFGDATAGGKLVHNSTDVAVEHAFGWWRPIPQVRFQIGKNSDGDFGAAQITGWGFTSEAKNIVALADNSYATVGFYPGTGGAWNFNFSLFPIDGLTVNLFFPWGTGDKFAANIVKTEINVVYNIEGIGTARLSYKSNTGYVEAADWEWFDKGGITSPAASPQAFLSFFLTAVEGMAFDLGFAYKFPFVNKADEDFIITTNHPVEIGLGYRIALGDFNFKLRTGLTFGGSTVIDAKGLDLDPAKDSTKFGIDILPTYKLGNITLYLYSGLKIEAIEDWEKVSALTKYGKNESSAVAEWFINPYILIPTDAMRFMVGLKIYSDGVKYSSGEPALVNWAIPLGFYVYF